MLSLPAGALLTASRVVIVARQTVRHEEALADTKEEAGHDAEQLRDDQGVASLVAQVPGGEEEVGGAGRHEDGVGQDVVDQELGGTHRSESHHVLVVSRQIFSFSCPDLEIVVCWRSEPGRPGDGVRVAGDVLARQLVVQPVIVVPGGQQQRGQPEHQAPHPVLATHPETVSQ